MKKNIDIVIRWILYIYAAIFPWCTYVKKLYYNSEEKRLISSEISVLVSVYTTIKATNEPLKTLNVPYMV